ncbi:Hpt domain-containing protein [Methylobacterium sp. 174MFSha1.1]|uniref:response regulator n=1 Tax=Methylobacterium sp. 174MFSha1.1 TaxID=1502749 RepID=UPI0008E22917|nr:response regulator [Methylobacterium sp. 174MFSha1.1]SFV17532.1 Hpt domain-containing protein [Methylobacterium sp. 174MFSha1.1]
MSLRLLVVEDDPGFQDLVRALCERRGDSVDVASDGFLGLRLLSERRHDVVMIDYHLPEMDGYALARLMREISRPEDQVRLIGVTADRHGLASRRGADARFDAILVKPLDPEALYAALDRLTRVEAPPPETGADAVWRRFGLAGRPRALICPAPGAVEAAAFAQAFVLVTRAIDADLILLSGEAGLPDLRAARAATPSRPVPSVDLTGRLGGACDVTFRVGDPASWAALAEACAGFASRHAGLAPGEGPADPVAHLLALLHVSARDLPLAGGEGGLSYETGLSPASLMAAVLTLTEAGALACVATDTGVSVRLTEAGTSAATAGQLPRGPRHPPNPARPPVLDARKTAELTRLIGEAELGRLRDRLMGQLATAFAPQADLPTLAHEAHVIVAMAGSLGFEDLAAACRTLESAIKAGSGLPDAVAEARRAVSDARSHCAAA